MKWRKKLKDTGRIKWWKTSGWRNFQNQGNSSSKCLDSLEIIDIFNSFCESAFSLPKWDTVSEGLCNTYVSVNLPKISDLYVFQTTGKLTNEFIFGPDGIPISIAKEFVGTCH